MPALNDVENQLKNEIIQKINSFFNIAQFTSSYKFILFKAILYILFKSRKMKVADSINYIDFLPPSVAEKIKQNNWSQLIEKKIYYIPILEISAYFITIYSILTRKFHLKQISSIYNQIGIIKKMDTHFPINKFPEKIPYDVIKQNLKALNDTKKLLFRTVFFILRKDLEIYQFADENKNLINIRFDINDENQFRKELKKLGKNLSDIKYIALHNLIYKTMSLILPILSNALNAKLIAFLNKFNVAPKLMEKIMFAEDEL
ncbi:MAG: hypothetical protein ACTSRZ_13745 [Promethearchaeota archaeon]